MSVEGCILANVELDINDEYYLDVHIWPDLGSMRKFTQEHDEVLACYNEGDIHLVDGEFGAGIFAHELQHFIQYWIASNELDPMNGSWEEVAYMAGNMTKDFWNWFYDNFEQKEI